MRTSDPRDLYERGLAYLQADYFHRPHNFSDKVTAVLDAASPLAATLLAEKLCVLEFDQFSQRYRLPCAVALLATRDAAREASLWHNRIFNPSLPDEVSVLQFRPDWASGRMMRSGLRWNSAFLIRAMASASVQTTLSRTMERGVGSF